jgi:hypothetical protein
MTDHRPPPRPDRERSAWVLLRHEAELRARLERMCQGLADPALGRVVDRMARPEEVRGRLSALNLALEEALRALHRLHVELTHPAEGTRGPGGEPHGIGAEEDPALPPGLARALERLRRHRPSPEEFHCEVGHDPVRGWFLRWKETFPDGTVVASGRLYERSGGGSPP